MNPLRPRTSSRRSAVILALACTGCAAGGIGAVLTDAALSVARKTFLGAATENYGEGYSSDFDKLLEAITGTVKGAAQGGQPAPTDPNAAAAAAPPPPAYVPPPITVDFALLKEEIVDGRSIPVPVENGDVLYDRFGSHGDGDNLKLTFRANQSCYVYVVNIDGTGWARPVFPADYTGFTNPVTANKVYEIPEGARWIPLDSYRGVEHVYLIACRFQRFDIEDALNRVAANVREEDPARQPSDQLAMVESDAPIARGFDTARLSTVEGIESQSGDVFAVKAESFLMANAADDLVVTRWFRHE